MSRFAVVLLMAAALTACGGGGGSSTSDSPPAGTSPPPATQPDPDPEPDPEPRFSAASLKGSYVYRSIGFSEQGPFLNLGHFTADGAGGISGRQENVEGAGLLGPIPFEGTYTVDEDGVGTASLIYNLDGESFNITVAIVVAGSEGGAILDREDDQVFLGEFLRQRGPLDNDRFSGRHVFSLTGNNQRAIGRLEFDGAGNVTGGDRDLSDNGFITLDVVVTGGNYQTDPQTGRTAVRVTTADGSSDFVVYPISPERAFVMATDLQAFARGDLWTQANTPLESSAVSGPYIFVTTGAASGGNLTSLGRFQSDGAGSLSDGRIHLDEPAGFLDDEPLSGSYVLNAQGVGDAVLEFAGEASNYGVRVIDAERLVYLQTDAGSLASGVAQRQQDKDFRNADFQGDYVFASDRLTADALTFGTGVLSADGGGVLELSGFGSRFQDFVGFSQPGIAASGTYVTRADGRGTASLPGLSDQFRYYHVDDETIVMIALDPNESQSIGLVRQADAM